MWHSYRGLVTRLSLARVPVIMLLVSLVLYLSGVMQVRMDRDYGLDDPWLIEISTWSGGDEEPGTDIQPALTALKDALARSGSTTSAIFVATKDADIGAGVYDVAGRWSGLPFSDANYLSTERIVSLRAGSLVAWLRPHVADFYNATQLASDFSGAEVPPGLDFVYPLLATTTLNGQLLISGMSPEDIPSLAVALKDFGYEVAFGASPKLVGEMARAPMIWLMSVLLILAQVSVAMAWGAAQLKLKDRLRKEVLLGATRHAAIQEKLPCAVVSWLLSVIAGTLLTFAAFRLVANLPVFAYIGSLWPVILVTLVADLGIATALFYLVGYRLTKVQT